MFDQAEKDEIMANAAIVLGKLANQAYQLVDAHLRVNPDFADFDPDLPKYEGDFDRNDPKYARLEDYNFPVKVPGTRNSYSTDWGNGMMFWGSLEKNQRDGFLQRIADKPAVLDVALQKMVASLGDDFRMVGVPNPASNAKIEFFDYISHINQINTGIKESLQQLKAHLDEVPIAWEKVNAIRAHYKDRLQDQNDIDGLCAISMVMHQLGSLKTPAELRSLLTGDMTLAWQKAVIESMGARAKAELSSRISP